METMHDRIITLMQYYNWNKSKFAKAANMSSPSVTNFFTRRTSLSFESIASLLKSVPTLSAAWLISGEGTMLSPPSDYVDLPVVGQIAAGNPIEFVEPPDIQYLTFSKKYLAHPRDYLLMRIFGDSMTPMIAHNDIILLHTVFDPEEMDHKIVAIRVDTEITLKLIIANHSAHQMILMPINHHYDPIILDEYSPPSQIIGYVVSIHRYL